MEKLFIQYLKVLDKSQKSVSHYWSGINTVNKFLLDNNFPIMSVYNIKTNEDLLMIKEFLSNSLEFLKKDNAGHHMYSVAFNHFCNFVNSDISFFNRNIANGNMDIPIDAPPLIKTEISQYKRNRIILEQALIGADYHCEINSNDVSFVARANNKEYMEGHHLIQLKYQNEFDNSLDVYANIVCLCPNCHKKIHYGKNNEREYMLDKLYEERKNRLILSNIDISHKEFLELAMK